MKFQQQQQQQQISSGPLSPQQEQLKHLKLQQLHMEQERLKKMQDEIARQVSIGFKFSVPKIACKQNEHIGLLSQW